MCFFVNKSKITFKDKKMLPSPHSFIYIFGFEIPWYGILFAVGLGVGGLASAIRSKNRKVDKFDAICCAVYAGIGGIVGAKLFSWMTSLDIIVIVFHYVDTVEAIRAITQGGFVFYGGLIGGFLGIVIYCKQFKLSYADFLDTYAVSVPLGHVFGRVGCFMSGCCYGLPHDGFFSVTYLPGVTADVNAVGEPRLAVQLIEAMSLLALYVVLEITFNKTKRKGLCTCLYIIGYSIIRFTLEYFRGDPARGFLLGMTTSQLISVLFVLSMVTVLIYNFFKKKYEDKSKGLIDAITSLSFGAVGLIFAVLLIALSSANVTYGGFGSNVTYTIMIMSLLLLTLIKGINRIKENVKLQKEQQTPNKTAMTIGIYGTVVSAVGLLLVLVSFVLLIVGIATFPFPTI